MGQATRPVPLHREKHPDLSEVGCFGCKVTGIGFGGLHSMQAMREDGTSGEGMKREIYEAARRDGRDITRAR